MKISGSGQRIEFNLWELRFVFMGLDVHDTPSALIDLDLRYWCCLNALCMDIGLCLTWPSVIILYIPC